MLVCIPISAQHFTHDVGFHVGAVVMQTDYGAANDFLSSYGNSSIALSFTHTLHFFNRDPRWNADHPIWNSLALRSELNFISSNQLRHYGEFTEGSTDLARELNAMTGETSIINVGFQLEYYLKSLKEFIYPWLDIKWNPYLLAGLQYSMFNNDMNSTLGDWRQDITVIPYKWRIPGALAIGRGSTLAATLGSGTRYKFNPKIDFNLQFNLQYFFSDSVDGLQANVIENKTNESLINFQFGIIYHLNFDKPIRLF